MDGMTRRGSGGRTLATVVAALALLAAWAGTALGAGEPAGLSAFSQSGTVQLAWQPVPGATAYQVYRGTTAAAITTPVGGETTATTIDDTGRSNGTRYFYAVRARIGAVWSGDSGVVSAMPRTRSCATGDAVRVENCLAGDWDWGVTPGDVAGDDIEGYATAGSVQRGGSLDLKVNTAAGATYDVEVFRSGWYDGNGARLVYRLEGLTGVAQPDCTTAPDTGLISCANWSRSATITTSEAWPSGVYLVRLVRRDTGRSNHVLFVVRDDAGSAEVLYGVGLTTYQAYNNYGGKSLYDYNSGGANTVAGTRRAVAVSFDRPYVQPRGGESLRDWYTVVDQPHVAWLERQGYSISYAANSDLDADPSLALGHHAYISPAHDEYYSAGMRQALTAARDAGVSLFFTGGNQVYWQVRFDAARRVMTSYKTVQSGPADPSGTPTSTWRDPAGANAPENSLAGVMYIGDKDFTYFPLRVSAEQGRDRVWRHTGLDEQAPGTHTDVGQTLVGWEWDAVVDNGLTPEGLTILAASPVTGSLVQNNGASYAPGTALAHVAKYQAASGALVFATGTNHWTRGLGRNIHNVGEPSLVIQQATVNVMLDMGVLPATPQAGIILDQGPTVSANTPLPGSTTAPVTARPTARFSLPLDPASVSAATITLAPASGGAALPAVVTYDAASRTATITPQAALAHSTQYRVRVTTGVRSTEGVPLSEEHTWTFTTVAPPPPLAVSSATPASGASGVALSISPRVTFNRAIVPASLTASSVRLLAGGTTPVTAVVSYDAATRRVTVDPAADLDPSTAYTLRLGATIEGADGGTLGSVADVTFTTTAGPPAPVAVTTVGPAPGSTDVPRATAVDAVLSAPADPASVNGTSFTLTPQGGSPVAAAVAYDAATRTATLTPSAPLAADTLYTARLTQDVTAPGGDPLVQEASWSFRTEACLCSLFGTPTPVNPANATQDGRPGPGPFSYELGVRIDVAQATRLDALRFYKSPGETGTHVGRVWDPSGTEIANVTFAAETASGWQVQALAAPVVLQAGTTYTVSVNANDFYPYTAGGLAQPVTSGPIATATDTNGVYAAQAGLHPTASYENGNYFVDVVAVPVPAAPAVTGASPAAGATGVPVAAVPTAVLSRPVDAPTVGAATVRLTTAAGTAVPATVTYVPATRRVTVRPSAPLAYATTYRVAFLAGITAPDAPALAPVSWTFTTEAGVSPSVTATTPAPGTAGVDTGASPTVTFSRAMDAATLTTGAVTLRASGGAAVAASVSYDAGARRVTVDPVSPLAAGTAYTVEVSSAARAADGAFLASPVAWSFTTVLAPVPAAPAPTAPATPGPGANPPSTAGATPAARGLRAAWNRSAGRLTLRLNGLARGATVKVGGKTVRVRGSVVTLPRRAKGSVRVRVTAPGTATRTWTVAVRGGGALKVTAVVAKGR